MRVDADLYLVGLGMYELRHLSVESAELLRAANAVYHTSDKHDQLCAYNAKVEDLRPMYLSAGRRTDADEEIAAYVIAEARRCGPIAVAIDGNPMFYSDLSWKIAARAQGLRVEALPGVSCLDVLPMQLGFEPGDLGMQIFDSTQMVLYQLALNPYLSTLILQIGYFGEISTLEPPHRDTGAYAPLVEHLLRFFPANHPAIFIKSARNSLAETAILTTEVCRIDEIRNAIRPGMTLYLPRLRVPEISEETRVRFGLPPMEGPR